MKHSLFSRLLSAVLAVSMLLQLLPVQQLRITASAETINDESSEHDVSVVGEVESLREADAKHFLMSDGSYIAVSYGFPVHYESTDGSWEDIDNTISLNTTTGSYGLNRSDASVSIANDLSDGTVLTSAIGNASVSMSLLDTAQALQMLAEGSPDADSTNTGEVTASIPDEAAGIEAYISPALTGEEAAEQMSFPETGAEPAEESPSDTDSVIIMESPVPNIWEEAVDSSDISMISFDRNTTVHIIEDVPASFSVEEEDSSYLKDITPAKIQSSWIYEEAFPSVDLLYTAYGNNIKEEIIVKEPQEAYRYDFLLELEGLTAVLQDDGSVSLVDPSGSPRFLIPVPLMRDSNGEVSYDVHYTLAETAAGTILAVEADSEWINAGDRVFPVSIDPTLGMQVTVPYNNIHSNYVMEGEPNSATAGRSTLYVGATTQSASHKGRFHLFLYFDHLPKIPQSGEMIGSSIIMNMVGGEYRYAEMASFPIGVYEVTDTKPSKYASHRAWLESFTWNTHPGYNKTHVYDYQTVTPQSKEVSWDITKLVKKWYEEGTSNRIIMFKMMNESELKQHLYYASTCFYAYNTDGPVLVVSYRNNTGIEPYYTYATMNGLASGTAHIADATGQLKVAKELFGYASTSNPFSLNLVYNSDYFFSGSDEDYIPPTEMGLNMGFGSGWTMNYIQKVCTNSTLGNNYLEYHDGDGTVHYFYKKSNKYLDEDGLGLTITVNSTNNYTMTDEDGNSWIFTNNFLSSTKDSDGNEIIITSNSNQQITSIEHKNVGQTNSIRIATFTYDGNVVSKITDYAGNEYALVYSNGALTSIKKQGSVIAEYSYDARRVTKMTDAESAYSIEFSYVDGKVSSYKEKAGSETGAHVKVSHQGSAKTTYQDSGLDRTFDTSDDILTHYLFDDAQRTVNAYTTDLSENILGASNAVYSGHGTTDRTNNRTLRSSSIGVAAQQLIRNSGLESTNTSDAWNFSDSGILVSSTNPRTGSKALAATLTGTGIQYAQKSTESLMAGNTYTFSGYVNTSGASFSESRGKIYLKVSDGSGNSWTSQPVNYVTALSSQSTTGQQMAWVRISVTFTAKTAGVHTVWLCNDGVTGTVYADDFQLEAGSTPSSYNLVENGSMNTEASDLWTLTGGGSGIESNSEISNSSFLRIDGTPLKERYAYQEIPVNLSGQHTYVLSGWAYTDAVVDNVTKEKSDPAKDINKQCGLRAIIYYEEKASDGTNKPEYHYVAFNPQIQNQWQFTSTAIVPKDPERTVTKIRVICAFDKNANTCYFDNVSLVREAAQTMTYDEDGNLKSVTTTELSEDVNTYENGNLIQTVTGGYGTFTYEYDTNNTHRLISASNGKIKQTMDHDTVGNVNHTKLSQADGSGKTIETSAAYDSTGNRLMTMIDSTDASISYAYGNSESIMTGLPTSVTAPNGVTTTSAYDDYNRVTQTSIANVATLLYTYTSGNLSTVKRTSSNNSIQTYHFAYDAFGNMAQASVGSKTLASYTYGAQNGLLTKQTYGNGDVLSFTYDNLGRTKTASFDDGRVLTYNYNGEGTLHSVTETDGDNVRTYQYNYDVLGRLISFQRVDNDTMVLRTGQHFNQYNQLDEIAWQTANRTYVESYEYSDTDGSLITISGNDDQQQQLTYDGLSRISQRVLTKSSNTFLTESYTYRDLGSNKTTTQISKKEIDAGSTDISFAYTYDVSGNILSETKTASESTSTTYAYDSQNQLIRENNQAAGKTWVWTYDTVGNLLSRKEYAYTTGSLGTVLDTVAYAYGDTEWKDLLTSFDGNAISYDTIGNPLNDGKRTYVWQNGRQLAEMSSLQSDETVEFTYDASGLRTGKKVITGLGAAHTHSFTTSVVSPTCMDGGYTLHACSCGYSYKTDHTEARGHYYATSNSTCTRCGSAQHTHSYTSTVVAPTCTEGGYTLHTCQCGNSYKDTETAARGHFYATSTSPCSRCGHVQGEASGSSSSTIIKEYSYIYSGDTLVEMDIRTIVDNGTPVPDVLTFTYDANGYPATVTSNGVTYYYVTNLQGDVVAILDSDRSIVVQYTYDAWGQVLSTTGSLAATLGETNPLRYRSYVYDSESGLYYLQSRYYDPEVGRFLNTDVFISSGHSIVGYNMLAYCENNPSSRFDVTGTRSELIDITLCITTRPKEEPIPEPVNTTTKAAHESSPKKEYNYAGTVSIGGTAGVGFGPWIWGVQGFVTIDAKGLAAVQYGFWGGISAGSNSDKFSYSLMPFLMVTNAPSYSNLEGYGIQVGAAIGNVSADYVGLLDSTGENILYHGMAVGYSGGTNDVHVTGGVTGTLFSVEFDWDLFRIVTQY